MNIEYFNEYFEDLKRISDSLFLYQKEVDLFLDLLELTKEKNGKVIIAGNGGSAAIASHFSVDLTKVSKIRCINFNEPGLITCFGNDYGYEHWLQKALESFVDMQDIVILISSKGESKNILNAAKWLKTRGISLITFSGFDRSNSLNSIGGINFWVDSNQYNKVELTHLTWLLAINDFFANSTASNQVIR